MNSARKNRYAGGFTLIELMITLVIAAILMAVVAPGMANLVDSNRVQTTTENLFTSMMLTRSEALKRNREVVMCKSSDGTSCAGSGIQWEDGWLVYVDVDGDGAPDADEILRVNGALTGGSTLRVAEAAFEDEISYGTDGTASGTGTFIICNESGDTISAREVAVAFTGRPKMNKTTASCTPSYGP